MIISENMNRVMVRLFLEEYPNHKIFIGKREYTTKELITLLTNTDELMIVEPIMEYLRRCNYEY